MPDDPKDRKDEPSIDQLEGLSDGADDLSSRERFERISRIALLMSYDLIDKLRYWEKETVSLSEEQVSKRAEHLAKSVTRLREAYLTFSELDP
jgi:hypothetical protein